MTSRRTIVTQGRLAINAILLQAGRDRSHGLQVLTFEQFAARLAGGFARPIDTETLMAAVREALASTALGELDEIKSLPGMLQASAQSLRRAWLAGIDLSARAMTHPRIASMAALEAAVVARLPPDMLRPPDLAKRAAQRVAYAPAIFGSVDIVGMTELSPVWRPLLEALKRKGADNMDCGPTCRPDLAPVDRDHGAAIGALLAESERDQRSDGTARSDRSLPMGKRAAGVRPRRAARDRHHKHHSRRV